MSDSTTVESIRTARPTKRRSRVALFRSTARVISSTTSGPRRRVSLRTVDSSGTRALSAMRQKRPQVNRV